MAVGLYDNGYTIYYKEGDRSLQRDFLSFTGSVYNLYHTIVEGETLYSIALKYYKSSYSWFIIADANPELITDIFDLPVGEIILIPNTISV